MSEVTICNLALSHLGDTANVQSIKPPDNSKQAQLCAKFYYVARNSLLEMANWGFATKRAVLALVSDPLAAGNCPPESGTPCVPDPWPPAGPDQGDCCWRDGDGKPWRFAYAQPSDMLNALVVMPKHAPSDYEAWFGPVEKDFFPPYPQGYLPVPGAPLYVPQPFVIETQTNGSLVILTDVCDAVLRYTAVVTDTTKFSPLFILALSHLMASMLAGPIIKGDAGIAAAEQQLQLFNSFKGAATSSDANQRKVRIEPSPSWIRGR